MVFANFIDTYYDIIDEFKSKSNLQKNRTEEINREHKEIVEAIMERDILKAREKMCYHLQKVKESALDDEKGKNIETSSK